jgi:hypothetical protein
MRPMLNLCSPTSLSRSRCWIRYVASLHSPWQGRPTRLPLHTHEQAESICPPSATIPAHAYRITAAIAHYDDLPPTNLPSSKHPPNNGATRGQTSSTTSWPPSSTCTPSTSHWAVKRPREAHMLLSRRHMPRWSVSLPSRRPLRSLRRT